MELTNVLLGGCGVLLGFTLARLWVLNGDVRAVRTALMGLNGGHGGLVAAVEDLEVSYGRHHVALALLSGRISSLDGKPDVEI